MLGLSYPPYQPTLDQRTPPPMAMIDEDIKPQVGRNKALTFLLKPDLEPLSLNQIQPVDPATIADLELRQHYSRLMASILDNPEVILDAQAWQIMIVHEQQEHVRQQVESILDYGYHARYTRVRQNSQHASPGFLDIMSGATRMVVCQKIAGQQVVLATMRCVAGSELEIFEFFEPLASACWPHTAPEGAQKPGELGKLAFHPLFDRQPAYSAELSALLQLYRIFLLRLLWQAGLEQLQRQQVKLIYGIHAAHVTRFFERAGLPFQQVGQMALCNNAYTRAIHSEYHGYWRPDGQPGQRPALYIHQWHLQRVTWQINEQLWTMLPIQIEPQRSMAYA